MNQRTLCLCFALLGSGLLNAQPVTNPAQENVVGGGLMVLPTRVVLEGRDRSAEVALRNAGAAPASYRVQLQELTMNEDGKMVERTRQPGELALSNFLYFSPKQVDLAPGEVQTVRLQVRKPENLPAGEYRTHMVFQAVPPPTPAPAPDAKAENLSFSLTIVMGLSIPVFLRQGQMEGKVALTGLRYYQPDVEGAAPVLTFRMERSGNCSMRGDLTASVESGGKLKKGTVLYAIKNVAVYPEAPFRNIYMPMWQNQDGSLKGARIKVTFESTEQKLPLQSAFLDMAP